MNRVFELVKAYQAVLATGHLSAEETFCLVDAARLAGVEKIVVTHPEWWLTEMTVEQQMTLVKRYGVTLERCYAQNLGIQGQNGYLYKSNLPSNLEIIKEAGYQNVLISTDGGQVENPSWDEEEVQYQQYLADHGIPQEPIFYMTRTLPARLLGL